MFGSSVYTHDRTIDAYATCSFFLACVSILFDFDGNEVYLIIFNDVIVVILASRVSSFFFHVASAVFFNVHPSDSHQNF